MKFRPVTNVEWDKIKREIEHQTLPDLPLSYDNILVSGNILTIETIMDIHSLNFSNDYIVIEQKDWWYRLHNSVFRVLVRYCEYSPTNMSYWTGYEQAFKGSQFPTTNENKYRITRIRGTLSKQELHDIKNVDDLKRIYDKYNLTYDK